MRFCPTPAIKAALIAASFALSAFSLTANATLYTSNGVDLVYSSVSDVTWTKDGNLLHSMMLASDAFSDSGDGSTHGVIDEIIAASSGKGYTVTLSDFSSDGRTTWIGAFAFVNYLNSITYGGSSSWYLPTVTDIGSDGCNFSYNGTDCGYNVSTNGTAQGDELAELYYQELGSLGLYHPDGYKQSGSGIVDQDDIFINEQTYVYWTGTVDTSTTNKAWAFNTIRGLQGNTGIGNFEYVWAVTSGSLVTAVPEPEFGAMLLLGLGIIGFVSGRKTKNA